MTNKLPITVTEAARNFADCVNRSHYQNVTFVLLKNGLPVAEIAPTREKVCTGRELAAALVKVNLSDSEAKAWRRDRTAGRKALLSPEDKWR